MITGAGAGRGLSRRRSRSRRRWRRSSRSRRGSRSITAARATTRTPATTARTAATVVPATARATRTAAAVVITAARAARTPASTAGTPATARTVAAVATVRPAARSPSAMPSMEGLSLVGGRERHAHNRQSQQRSKSVSQHDLMAPLKFDWVRGWPYPLVGTNTAQAFKNIPMLARKTRNIRKIFWSHAISRLGYLGCATKEFRWNFPHPQDCQLGPRRAPTSRSAIAAAGKTRLSRRIATAYNPPPREGAMIGVQLPSTLFA